MPINCETPHRKPSKDPGNCTGSPWAKITTHRLLKWTKHKVIVSPYKIHSHIEKKNECIITLRWELWETILGFLLICITCSKNLSFTRVKKRLLANRWWLSRYVLLIKSSIFCNCLRFKRRVKFLSSLLLESVINYLLTESEVFTRKCQTETLPYWPSDSEVNMESSRFEILP